MWQLYFCSDVFAGCYNPPEITWLKYLIGITQFLGLKTSKNYLIRTLNIGYSKLFRCKFIVLMNLTQIEESINKKLKL